MNRVAAKVVFASSPWAESIWTSPSLRYAAAGVASALLCRLTCPPFDMAPLAFVAWVPVLFALRDATPWRGVQIGLLQGLFTNVAAFHWLVGSLREGAELPAWMAVCVVAGLCLWQSLRAAIVCGLWAAIAPRAAWLGILLFGALLSLAERLFPMVFPFGTYGLVHAAPVWGQLACLAGAGLVTFVIAVINGAVAVAFPARRAVAWAVPLAAIALLTLQGKVHMRAVEQRMSRAPETRVLVVQGGLRPSRNEPRDPAMLYRELTMQALTHDSSAQWLAWPETALFVRTRVDALPALVRNLQPQVRSAHGAPRRLPLVTGIALAHPEGRLIRDLNSVVLGDELGRVTGRYDKQRLVPVIEAAHMRFVPPALSLGSFVSSPNAGGLDLGPHHIGVLLCFEILDATLGLNAMDAGRTQLLLNPASDAWFGDSYGPDLHLAFAKIRAIEHERFLLRPTTTGISALVAPTGRVIWSLPNHRAAAGVAHARWLHAVTPFTRMGSTWFEGLCLLLCAAAWLNRRHAAAGRPMGTQVRAPARRHLRQHHDR